MGWRGRVWVDEGGCRLARKGVSWRGRMWGAFWSGRGLSSCSICIRIGHLSVLPHEKHACQGMMSP